MGQESEEQQRVRRAWKQGQAVWPKVPLTVEAFLSFVRERALAAEAIEARAGEFFLVAGCVAGLSEATQAFEDALIHDIPRFVARMALSPDEIEEVRQRTRVKLFVGPNRGIDRFGGNGELRAWFRVSVLRVALDVRARRLTAAPDVPSDEQNAMALMEADDSPEMETIRARYRPVLKRAIQKAVSEMPSRERAVLRLYAVEGAGIDGVATIYRVHRSTAARWLIGVRKRILSDTKAIIGAELGTTSSEFSSLTHLLAADLHASLQRILSPTERASLSLDDISVLGQAVKPTEPKA